MDSARIARIPIFAGLAPDQLERVAGMCVEVEIEDGATLVYEGDFGYSIFAISAGTADVDQDGVVIRTLGPGDVFGEMAVLSGGRRTATVVATSPMQLITLLNRDIWRLEQDAPEIGAALRLKVAEQSRAG